MLCDVGLLNYADMMAPYSSAMAPTTAIMMLPTPAAMKLTMDGSVPPIAIDCAPANSDPAATLPIPACIDAATDPGLKSHDPFRSLFQIHCFLPANGPAAPNPTSPNTAGATTGALIQAHTAPTTVISNKPAKDFKSITTFPSSVGNSLTHF